MPDVFSIYGIARESGAPDFLISNVFSNQIDSGFNIFKAGGSGNPYDAFATVMESKPMVSFSTTQLKVALDVIGMLGAGFDGTLGALDLYFKRRLANAIYETTNHEKISCPLAFAIPKRLALRQGSEAMLDVDAYVIGDGVNGPMVFTQVADGVLPAFIQPTQVHTLGPIKIGATLIDTNISEATIDFGITVECPMGNGQVEPTRCHITKIRPMISVKFLDIAQVRALLSTQVGAANNKILATGNTTDVAIYARKKLLYGGNVPDATAEHVKFTGAAALYEVKQIGGQDAADASVQLDIHLLMDGVTVPLAINTAIAIT